jgi:hypothetical protein
MVQPGDVDEGLEDEVAEEASRFGEVVQVLIFEVDGDAVPTDQAVWDRTCCWREYALQLCLDTPKRTQKSESVFLERGCIQ